jgi:thiamine biosynthesis lipoprotein
MMLDLGAIAKGYACDEALRVLSERGVSTALIGAGGEVVASGPPPDSPSWSVMDSSGQRMALSHSAISTSGDSEQFIQIGSERYSHVLDSNSGLGWSHRRSTVVRADSGMIADALATAISCTDAEGGQALADRFGAVILKSAVLQK